MGKQMIVYLIYPEEDKNEEIIKKIQEAKEEIGFEEVYFEEVPVFANYKGIKAKFITPPEEGFIEKIESFLENLEEVQDFQFEVCTLI
jgi:translation elongation factor EF-1beta